MSDLPAAEPRTASLRPAVAGLLYLALALGLTWVPWGTMPGDSDADVWNHAWGYWWWAESLARGELPLWTDLLASPDGGALYYVDPIGALLALPLTWTVGPGHAFRIVQVARLVFSAAAAHALSREVSGPGRHNLVAGVAFASSPYLLSELGNGISELATQGWVPLVLLAAARAFKGGGWRSWAALGLLQGIATVACFYYGAATALVVAAWGLLRLPWLRLRGLWGGALAVVVALAVAGPPLAALKHSLSADDAMIERSESLDMSLMAHNATDPRIYVMPGDFQSVDLLARGEEMVHTGYFRWSLLALLPLAVARLRRRSLTWLGVAGGSVVLGLGAMLWYDGAFVSSGGQPVWLPYGWVQYLVPELAMTHPLRLSVVAQAAVAVLGAAALAGRGSAPVVAVCVALVVEGTVGSSARWPLPHASMEVPEIYEEIARTADERAVLDLPAELAMNMATSVYLFYQTHHGRPVPWYPHVRANANADQHTTMKILPHPGGDTNWMPPTKIASLTRLDMRHLQQRYGWILLHTEFDRRDGYVPRLRSVLEEAFGTPRVDGPVLVWRVPERR